MKTRKRNEQHILYSLVMVIVLCLFLWFGLTFIVNSLDNPERPKEEVLMYTLKNII